ncbi:MAG: cupin domain-containing protein [Chloroflexi bacterium]|nr:cupin domain-containing protein [Chloroflexota bacterium]
MPVYNGWELPSAKLSEKRAARIVASPETTGYENATVLFSLLLPDGGTTGLHIHPDSDEIIHFCGRGEVVMDGQVVPIEEDSVLVVKKGIEHEARNVSPTETLKLFCVFIPPMKLSPVLTELAEKTKEFLG